MSHQILNTLHRDYNYKPIAYHDSWISVDPIIGCQLDCKYCFLQMNGWTNKRPSVLYTITETVNMLLANKYFIPHKSIVSFGNSTDAFLPSNADFTLGFLEELESRHLRNPVVFVTKKMIPSSFICKIKEFEYIKPVFCLSYSGLPGDMERGVKANEIRMNFLNLSKNKLSVIHFWRPILRINGTPETVKQMLDFVTQYSIASVYIGLKLHPSLTTAYKTRGLLAVPEDVHHCYGDYIPFEVKDLIRLTAASKYPDYPIYRHTSCAVSLALSIADYNATVYRKEICNNSNCPAYHRRKCETAQRVPTESRIADLLNRIGVEPDFAIHDSFLQIFSKITQEDYTFILHQVNFPIIAKNIVFNMLLYGSIFRKGDADYVTSRSC